MINLGVFFTRNVGVDIWLRDGIFTRETMLYEALREKGVDTTFFSYDNFFYKSRELAEKGFSLKKIHEGLFHRNFISNFFDSFNLSGSLKGVDIIRTNQFFGAGEALAAAKLYNKPLVMRGGYVASRFFRWQGKSQNIIRNMEAEEREAAEYASAIIVTTLSMKKYLMENYSVSGDKIFVVGNCIPDNFFKIAANRDYEANSNIVMTVGRHHPQKGYDLLLKSCIGVSGAKVVIIGAGPEQEKDRKLALKNNLDFEFIPRVDNKDIPGKLSECGIYVMTSHYEGHPKSLLEAMACGCACIVTEGPGVSDEIENNKSGIIVSRDEDALREAIARLQGDAVFRKQLGENAAAHIRSKYSVEKAAEAELSIYKKILQL